MPAITCTPETLSTDTFFATYANKASSSGTDFSTDLSTYIVATSTSNRRITGVIFKVNGVPQGSVVNSVALRLRFNNGSSVALAAAAHGYLAVENNLDPHGAGAVVNGTLGAQPWQRLGRQSAATTLLGVRCGPTHSGDLSTTGRTPRDTQSYIYKTWVTNANQSTASANSAVVTATAWNTTCDFSAGLQALVNDPGWNDTTQYVLVWLFSDEASGTDYNIGSMASISYASGTVGASTTYANSDVAQMYTNTYPPEMLLDYTSESLKAKVSGSTSYGTGRLSTPVEWGRWCGERTELTAGNPVIPRWSAGAHDLPPTGMVGVQNPLDVLWNSGSPAAARLKTVAPRVGRVDGRPLWAEDYAGATPGFYWDLSTWQSDFTSLDVYSMRFYHRYDQNTIAGNTAHVFSVQTYNGSAWVDSWKVQHQAYRVGSPDRAAELRINATGDTTAYSTYEFRPPASTGYYRYEVQVDANATPKVRMRVYLNEGTTPLATFAANPTTVACQRLLFRDFQTDAIYFFSFRVSDLELWSDYNLNRQFPDDPANTTGTPYVPQTVNWFEWDGTTAKQVDDIGEISSVSGGGGSVVMDALLATSTEDYTNDLWVGTSDQAWASKTTYTYATNRTFDLYIPPGTAPTNGWPVLVYNHGGFWVSGTKATIHDSYIKWAMLNGYAVASGNYVLGQVTTGSYPSWNSASATGRYPTFILDFKTFGRHLQDKGRVTGDSTYDIDGSWMIASGHSAGGYNALAAACSRELDSDGGGRSLRLANSGNISAYGTPNLADPTFKACAVLAAPVNLFMLRQWDPTHPNYPYLGSGQGLIRATGSLFMGNAVTATNTCSNTGADDFVRLNAARQIPTYYAWGGNDFTVISAPYSSYAQAPLLADAWSDFSGTIPAASTLTIVEYPDAMHHTMEGDDVDFEHLYRWLNALT